MSSRPKSARSRPRRTPERRLRAEVESISACQHFSRFGILCPRGGLDGCDSWLRARTDSRPSVIPAEAGNPLVVERRHALTHSGVAIHPNWVSASLFLHHMLIC